MSEQPPVDAEDFHANSLRACAWPRRLKQGPVRMIAPEEVAQLDRLRGRPAAGRRQARRRRLPSVEGGAVVESGGRRARIHAAARDASRVPPRSRDERRRRAREGRKDGEPAADGDAGAERWERRIERFSPANLPAPVTVNQPLGRRHRQSGVCEVSGAGGRAGGGHAFHAGRGRRRIHAGARGDGDRPQAPDPRACAMARSRAGGRQDLRAGCAAVSGLHRSRLDRGARGEAAAAAAGAALRGDRPAAGGPAACVHGAAAGGFAGVLRQRSALPRKGA